MPTSAALVSTATDLANLLPVTNGSVTIGANTLPGSLMSDILSTFNGGQSLQITTQTPAAILNNGVTLSGSAPFLGSSSVQLSATFQVNGDFVLTATVQHLSLTQLTSCIKDITLPHGMGTVDLGTVQVIVAQAGGTLTLSAAASNSNIGEFAFQAQKSTKWGAAFGFEVNAAGIAGLPGLKNTALAKFDAFVGLSNLLMVLSSFDAPNFDFPDVVSFNGSSFTGVGKIALPGSGALQTGLNIFASIAGNGSAKGATAQLTRRLHLDGLSAALSVSLPDPLTSSQLYFSLANVAIQKNVTLNGSFGGRLASSSVGVFFDGTVLAPIQNQQVTFTAQAIAAPTGVVLGGSMQADTGLKFDVGNTKFNIFDLGFVIGIDDDGLPSLGFAATFDINAAEVAAAVFIDTVNPAQSVFAAAVSSFSLYDIATCIAGQKSGDLAGMKSVLDSFELKGTQNFSLPGSLGASLDTRDLKAIAGAFQNSAQKIALPNTYDKVQVHVNTRGSKWYVTDLTTQYHYSLSSSNGAIAVQLEPQFYFAGQNTSIGALIFPKGFFVSGEIDLYILKASVDVVVELTGLLVEMDVAPVTLGGSNFFALTGASGSGGPRVSIATMSQPQLTDPILSQPHVLISGEVKVLGIDLSSTYFIASATGVTFKLHMQASPWLSVDLSGNVGNSSALYLSGSVTLGLADTFDLGTLGSISLPSITPAFTMGYNNGVAYAHFAIVFTLGPWTVTAGKDLDVNVGAFSSLATIQGLLHSQLLVSIQTEVKKDATQWLHAVQAGSVTASQDINDVANVLQYQFGKDAQDISNILASAKYSADEIYNKVLKTLSPGNADTILHNTTSLSQDQINSVTTYTTGAYINATTILSNLESSVQSAGNQVVNFLEGLVGKSTGSSNADAALDNALDSATLKQPALAMQQFNSLARIRPSGGNDTFILGVGTDHLPYLVTWMHARGHGWKGGRMLPYPPVQGFALSSMSMGTSHTGDAEVFGLGTDGTPYLVAYMGSGCYGSVIDRRQGWNAGMALPCPSGQSKFTAMAHTLSPGGDLEIVGIGQDKKAYLISYLTADCRWLPGIPLPCPASQNQFTSIGISHSNNNVLQVYGLGVDNLPYRIAFLDQGGWKAGEALPCPAGQSHFRNLVSVGSAATDLWIFGLGVDGLPYLVSSIGTGGNFYAGHALPVFSGAVFHSLEAAGGSSNGDLLVFCLGTDNRLYLASLLTRGATIFLPGAQLPNPPQQNQFQSLSFTLASTGDAEVCGLGVDGKPYIVTYIGNSSWQPGACMNIS